MSTVDEYVRLIRELDRYYEVGDEIMVDRTLERIDDAWAAMSRDEQITAVSLVVVNVIDLGLAVEPP